MTTEERIEVLREAGFEQHVIAALLGADVDDVAAQAQDPASPVPIPVSLQTQTSGDAHPRVSLNDDGTITFGDGASLAEILLALDPVNQSNKALGIFPAGNAGAIVSVYHAVHPNGDVDDDTNCMARLKAVAGEAEVRVTGVDDSVGGYAILLWTDSDGGELALGGLEFGQSVTLSAAAANLVGVGGNGAGFQLHSPDGTAYNVNVANGGTWHIVAA